MELNETKSRLIKTVTATVDNYNLSATATIEDGKIISMNGYVVNTTTGVNDVRFDASRHNDQLRTNYYGITEDDRDTVSVFNDLIDAVVAAYEV